MRREFIETTYSTVSISRPSSLDADETSTFNSLNACLCVRYIARVCERMGAPLICLINSMVSVFILRAICAQHKTGEEVEMVMMELSDRIYWNICITLLINSNNLPCTSTLLSRFEEALKRGIGTDETLQIQRAFPIRVFRACNLMHALIVKITFEQIYITCLSCKQFL